MFIIISTDKVNLSFKINKVVSFQTVFVTNYALGKSYAIFNYESGATWNGKDKSVLMGYTDGKTPVKILFSNSDNSNIDPYAIFSSVGNTSN